MSFVEMVAALSSFGLAGFALVHAAENDSAFNRTGLLGSSVTLMCVGCALLARGCP